MNSRLLVQACVAMIAMTSIGRAATNFSYNFDDYSNGSTPPGMQLVGNAVITDDLGGGFTDQRLRLTFSGAGQQGSGWRNTISNVSQSFDTTFTFQISFLGGGGADGFSFNVHNQGSGINTSELGPGAGSLTVSFDTWNNGGSEPSDNFIRVFSSGATLATRDMNSGAGSVNLSDSATHTARVVYAPGDLDVYINGVQVISNVAVTLATGNGLVSGTGSSYVGFGGRTGGSTENHDIKTWSFSGNQNGPTAVSNGPYVFSAGTLSQTLNSSGSSDAETPTGLLVHSWQVAGGGTFSGASPTLSIVQSGLTGTTATNAVTLTVTDLDNATANSNSSFSYTNAAPTANAGANLAFSAASPTVTANGSVIDADLAVNGLIAGFETTAYSWGYGNAASSANNPVTLSQAIGQGLTSTTSTANLPLTVTDQAGASSNANTTLSYANSGPTVSSATTTPAPNYGITFNGVFSDADLFANGLTPSFENLIFEFDLTQAANAAQVGDGFLVGATTAAQTTPGTLNGTLSLTQLMALFGGLGTFTAWANVRDGAGAVGTLAFQVNVVPEPTSLAIWTVLGAVALGVRFRRSRG